MQHEIKISVIRDCRSHTIADKAGPCPVKLRVYCGALSRQPKHYPLLFPDGSKAMMTKKDLKGALSLKVPAPLRRYNSFLTAEINRARSIVETLHPFSFSAFKREFTGNMSGLSLSADLLKLAERKSESTRRVYGFALQKLAEFLGKEDVSYSDLTPEVIENFVFDMEDEDTAADTIITYMRVLKAAVNAAKKKKKLPSEYDPFAAYVPPKSEKRQLQLSLTQFRAYVEYSSPILARQFARDVIVFCTLCVGQYTATVFRLKKADIRGNWLHFKRQKTGTELKAYITETMWDIIRRYEDKSGEYLFPVLTGKKEIDHYNTVFSWRGRVNFSLKSVTEELNKKHPMLRIPDTTVKYCRGTYIKVAVEEGGLSYEQASRAAGHTSLKTTGHYYDGRNLDAIEKAAQRIG